MIGDGATNNIKTDAQYVPTIIDDLGLKIYAINIKLKKNRNYLNRQESSEHILT